MFLDIIILTIMFACIVILAATKLLGDGGGLCKELKFTFSNKKARGLVFGKKFGLFVYAPIGKKFVGRAINSICIAPTGAGKSSAYLLPTIQGLCHLNHDGNNDHIGILTIDISGDLFVSVSSPCKMVFQPTNPHSTPFNIFGEIDRCRDLSNIPEGLSVMDLQDEALSQLALQLMPDLPSNSSDAGHFFNRGGRAILTSCLQCYYHLGLDFCDIAVKMASLPYKELFNDIEKHDNSGKATRLLSQFYGCSEMNTAGCLAAALSATELFSSNPFVQATVRRPRPGEEALTPSSIESHHVFVVIPDEKLRLYSQLLRVLVSASINYFLARPLSTNQIPVLFCLDEFASFGKLDGLLDCATKGRKRALYLCLLAQELCQIDEIYGLNERKILMANMTFSVIMGANEPDTQLYFANKIGKKDFKKKSTTYGKNVSKTINSEEKYIIEPAEFSRLGETLVLLHPGKAGFLKLRKNYWFSKKFFGGK